jgi:ABC-type Fe3+/spermidine/putrescine transport system ATPase subunit
MIITRRALAGLALAPVAAAAQTAAPRRGGTITVAQCSANRFVASFVGDNSVLDARVIRNDGETCAVQLSNGVSLQGVNVNHAQVGDTVLCSVRPERIAFVDAANGGDNQIGVAPGAQTVHCKNMTDGGGGDGYSRVESWGGWTTWWSFAV